MKVKKTKSGMQFHLYHGEGKGKTTAALGLALRAWGWNHRVLLVQFLKEEAAPSGEVKAISRLKSRWRVLRSRLPCPVLKRPSGKERIELKRVTASLYDQALREVREGRCDVVVLDEALAAWKLGLLKVEDLRRFHREAATAGVALLVATGRWVPRTLLAIADLVTEMRQEKHPFEEGQRAKKGIEY